MLKIQNLTVHYEDFKALELEQEIFITKQDRIGVIGANGAGKSTFIKACLNMIPYQGTINTDIKPEAMAVHMQFNDYVDTLNTEIIMETILDTKIADNEDLKELITFFDFENSLKKKYKHLSGGQKQRFTLIMVLMQNAPLTFFDEVTTGLDFNTRQALIEKLKTWYQGKDQALLFVSHYYEELESLTNKLLILDKGKLVDFGERDLLFKKYCGYSVIIFPQQNEMAQFQAYRKLLAPKNMIALSCRDSNEEQEIMAQLSNLNVNFKRSNKDIEIVSLNAIKEQNL